MNNEITTTDSKTVKPCRKCGAADRYTSGDCRPCAIERSRNWYEAHPERALEQRRDYYAANREQYSKNKRKWREDNWDKVITYNREWKRANPDKVAEYGRNYRECSPEKVAESKQKWANANRERIKTLTHNRRAKIKGNGGKLSPNIVQTLMTLQKGKCACCGKSLKQGYHLDHIMPIALGGKNTDDNVQLLTPKCNLRKSDKHPDEWARLNGKLI